MEPQVETPVTLTPIDPAKLHQDKVDLFDRNYRALVEQCQETNKEAEAGKPTKRKNPIVVALDKYTRCYAVTKPEEHWQYWQTLYNEARIYFTTSKFDKWLTSKAPIVCFGYHIKKVKEKKINIYIGAIYRTACELEKSADDNLRLRNASSEEYSNCFALIRRDAIKYHLCKIFTIFPTSPDSEDVLNLNKMISELEESLGITTGATIGVKSQAPSQFGGLGDLFGQISKMMPGLTVSSATPGDSAAQPIDLMGLINNVMTNDALKAKFGAIVEDMKGATDAGDGFGKLNKLLGDGEITDALSSAFPALGIPKGTTPLASLPEGASSAIKDIIASLEQSQAGNVGGVGNGVNVVRDIGGEGNQQVVNGESEEEKKE